MLTEGTEAHLYLNSVHAGIVIARRHDHAWAFGDFTPTDQFATFAPLYGRWSLLMHADAGDERLSREAAEELRETERAMDCLKASFFVPSTGEWCKLAEINIDGPLIEWREA